jgi:predicted DNA-binding transcriptional regulator AlpA
MEPRSSKTESQHEDDVTMDVLFGNASKQQIRHLIEILARACGLVLFKYLLSARELAARLGISVAQVFRMNSSGALGPRPIKFGEKCSRWITAEVEAWVRAGCPSREQWLHRQMDKN